MIQEAASGVLTAQRDWLAAVRTKNIDALMRMVTDDIAVIHPNGKTIRGADELRADFERFFGLFNLEQSAAVEETVMTGEWAFDISEVRSNLAPVSGGEPKHIKSKVLTLLRRQGNEWRIARVKTQSRGHRKTGGPNRRVQAKGTIGESI
jgi:ketosteroid isomerase-like protein